MKPAATVNALALRGAVAAAMALVITTATSVQRPYWVIMIAVVLVNQTTGQSLRRSGERLAATLAGMPVGWALEWITHPHRSLEIVIMMAAVFLAVFFRQSWGRGSYPWMTFFISMYVVFLFALLGEWSPAIFATRVYNTLLGACAGLFATYVVPSPGSRERLGQEAEDLWNNCRKELAEAVRLFAAGDEVPALKHAPFLLQLDTVRSNAEEATYETFLSPSARREARDCFATTGMLCYLALGLFDAMACGRSSPGRQRIGKALLEKLEPVVNSGLGHFEPPPGSRTSEPSTPTRPEACRFATEQYRAAGIGDSELVWAMPALYYAGALSASLRPEAPARKIPPKDEPSGRRSLVR